MKKISSIIWGIVLIAAGALFALNALNITDIDIFFDGWWTLFIIVPCAVGLFTEYEKTGNIIGIITANLDQNETKVVHQQEASQTARLAYL